MSDWVGGSIPFSAPPEGVLAGESVPKESEPDNYSEQEIHEAMAQLKARGKPYLTMTDSELREKAIEKLRSAGVTV